MSTALERRGGFGPGKLLYDELDKRQLAALRNTVAKGLSEVECAHFLEVAQHLGLNPWLNEIWAAKSPGRDGGAGRVLIMVGRDGLISYAEKNYDDYLGYDADVVRAGDVFQRVAPDPEGKTMRERGGVVHTYASPADRGDVVGAWAVAERRGRPVRYFYAALSEYMPTGKKAEYSPWGKQTAAMVEKIPISYVHRTLCGLGSAVHLEEELAQVFDMEGSVVLSDEEMSGALAEAVERFVPEGLRALAIELMEAHNELAPGSWTAAKAEMVFSGKGEAAVETELEAIQKAIQELEARPEVLLAQEERDSSEEPLGESGEPEDAEVIEPDVSSRVPEGERAEGVRLRMADLEQSLEDPDLSDQEREDIIAELDSLAGDLPSGVSEDQSELPL